VILDRLFDTLDTNKDNYLDLSEIEEMIKHAHFRKNSMSLESVREEVIAFMMEADSKKNGRIDR
jgi:Ca2+-binding EF-hand superfamily protein